jgi:hypothetical protein
MPNKRLPTPTIGAYNVPFVALNVFRGVAGQRALLIVVLEVGDGYLCIEYQMGLSQVVLCAVKKGQFPQYYQETQDDLSAVTADLKSKALDRGATLEAIQLLGQLTKLTTAEEAEMAKAPAAKAAEKVAAAKPAATKAAKEPDNRKIKVLKKDHGARENSKTAQRYDQIIGAKTISEALGGAMEITMADINYAEKQGIISLD